MLFCFLLYMFGLLSLFSKSDDYFLNFKSQTIYSFPDDCSFVLFPRYFPGQLFPFLPPVFYPQYLPCFMQLSLTTPVLSSLSFLRTHVMVVFGLKNYTRHVIIHSPELRVKFTLICILSPQLDWKLLKSKFCVFNFFAFLTTPRIMLCTQKSPINTGSTAECCRWTSSVIFNVEALFCQGEHGALVPYIHSCHQYS